MCVCVCVFVCVTCTSGAVKKHQSQVNMFSVCFLFFSINELHAKVEDRGINNRSKSTQMQSKTSSISAAPMQLPCSSHALRVLHEFQVECLSHVVLCSTEFGCACFLSYLLTVLCVTPLITNVSHDLSAM